MVSALPGGPRGGGKFGRTGRRRGDQPDGKLPDDSGDARPWRGYGCPGVEAFFHGLGVYPGRTAERGHCGVLRGPGVDGAFRRYEGGPGVFPEPRESDDRRAEAGDGRPFGGDDGGHHEPGRPAASRRGSQHLQAAGTGRQAAGRIPPCL